MHGIHRTVIIPVFINSRNGSSLEDVGNDSSAISILNEQLPVIGLDIGIIIADKMISKFVI